MADNVINIIINTLKKGTGDKDAKNAVKELNAQFKSLTGFGLDAAGAMTVLIGAEKKLVEITKESLDFQTTKANQIEALTKLNGELAETDSRLIEMADDQRLSYESLSKAMEAAAKKGIDTSVESLGKLSDQYLALAPGVERAKFLTDNFGKSGTEMYKVMELGSKGIKDNIAAISSANVMDDKAVQSTIEYQEAVDRLNDSFDALKLQLAKNVTPALTDLLNILSYTVEKLEDPTSFASKWQQFSLAINLPYQALSSLLNLTDRFIVKQDNLNLSGATSVDWTWAASKGYVDLSASTDAAAAAVDDMTKANESFIGGVASWSSKMVSFNSNITDLYSQQADIEKNLADARKNGYSETGTKIQGYLGELGQINTKIADVKRQHEIESKTVILGFMQQKLAVDGLDDEETEWLLSMGEKWGVYAEGTTQAYQDMAAQADMFLGHRKAAEYDNTITVTTVYKTVYGSGYGRNNQDYLDQYGAGARAGGGDVYAGVPYKVGEKGIEWFVPKEDGTIIPNNQIIDATTPAGGGGNVSLAVGSIVISGANKNVDQIANEVSAKIVKNLKKQLARV